MDLILTEGIAPSRVSYYAKEGHLNERVLRKDTTFNIEVLQVFESPAEPSSISKMLSVDCVRRRTRETFSSAIYRDGRMDDRLNESWQPIHLAWQDRAREFACAEIVANDKSFVPVPDVAEHDLTNFTWKILWAGAKRPANTTGKTRSEILAQLDKTMQKARTTMEDASAQMQSSQGKLVDDLSQTRKRQLRLNEDVRRRQNTPNTRFETWIGATEQQLHAGFGGPLSVTQRDATGDRYISYRVAHVRQELRRLDGATVSSSDHYCDVTFKLQHRQVVTYSGDNFGGVCQAANVGTGPNPENGVVHR